MQLCVRKQGVVELGEKVKTWPVRQLMLARANGVFFLHLMVNIVILHMENLPHKISTYNYIRRETLQGVIIL